MSSQTTSSTLRKAAKRGRKLNSSGPSDVCRICTSSIDIHLKLPKVLNGMALATTMSVTQLFSKESSFYDIFYLFIIYLFITTLFAYTREIKVQMQIGCQQGRT